MSDRRPEWQGSDIVVPLGRDAISDFIEVVVDVDETGDVLGLEVLGLLFRHPRLTIPGGEAGQPSVSVDTDADAIYVRFAHGRSVNQFVRQAVIALDRHGRLQSIRVRMEQ
ncbi:MAG: hypothetical protein ABR600_05345 [Actinomycetota bacterium]